MTRGITAEEKQQALGFLRHQRFIDRTQLARHLGVLRGHAQAILRSLRQDGQVVMKPFWTIPGRRS